MGYHVSSGTGDRRAGRTFRAGDFRGHLAEGLGGLGFYGQPELEADKSKALALLSEIDRAVQTGRGTFAEVQATGISQAVTDATPFARSLDEASQFSQSARVQVGEMAPPGGFYSAMWLGSTAPIIQGIVSKATSTVTEAKRAVQLLGEVLASAQTAQMRAAEQQRIDEQRRLAEEADAAAAEQRRLAVVAGQVVSSAILQSQTLAGTGNFAGALAALNDPQVVAAARATGREGELRSAVAAVIGQQTATERAQTFTAQQAAAIEEARREAAALAAATQQRAIEAQQQVRDQRAADIQVAQIAAQAQIEAAQRREDLELRLAQMREESQLAFAERQAAREAAAAEALMTREEAAASRAERAAQQQALFGLLPGLLARPEAATGGAPGLTISLAILEAISTPGADVMSILARALRPSAPEPAQVAAAPAPAARVYIPERF
jgi:hypothetical protein